MGTPANSFTPSPIQSIPQHQLMQPVGTNITIFEQEHLGKGSYGAVSKCTDEYGQTMAVKQIEMDPGGGGIPNILESSIMATIHHIHLARAIRIHADESKLRIIQELALCDLAKHTRRSLGGPSIAPPQLQKWTHSLAQAVACLHRQKIIHADIKASNVLLYPDEIVKLSDFTLAVRKWENEECFLHPVCTITHRPLECLFDQGWDYSLDIWSLGCTFYEIAYGDLLFPYQGVVGAVKGERSRKHIKSRTIRCLLDWGRNGPGGCQKIPITFENKESSNTDFTPFHLSPQWGTPEKHLFNNLILAMLRLDPLQRPTIFEVLQHPYFVGMTPSPYMILSSSTLPVPPGELHKVERYLGKFTERPTVKRLALELYQRATGLRELDERIKAGACVWIASKLVLGEPLKLDIPLHQLLYAERALCQHLTFRLHVATNNVVEVKVAGSGLGKRGNSSGSSGS